VLVRLDCGGQEVAAADRETSDFRGVVEIEIASGSATAPYKTAPYKETIIDRREKKAFGRARLPIPSPNGAKLTVTT
jgi:hypothetical protein